ncbi:MAG: hypothetical protein J0H62_06140, partial [Rhizobiales bacterium]|nr:hypothetical protein [Hyphomicrobiales bacterium]
MAADYGARDIESFGLGFLDVSGCDRVHLVLVRRGTSEILRDFRFGNGPIEPSHGPGVVEAVGARLVRCGLLEDGGEDAAVEALLGGRPGAGASAIFGRLNVDGTTDLVLVAGWRLRRCSDIVLLNSAVMAIWPSVRRATVATEAQALEALMARLA